MQRDICRADAVGRQDGQQFLREMEPRGGCRHCHLSSAVGINCLVAFHIVRAPGGVLGGRFISPLNVGRERDVTEAVGHRSDRITVRRCQAHERRAARFLRDDFPAEGSAGMHERGADGQLFPGLDEATPDVRLIGGSKQKALDLSAGWALRVQARRQHGGVVAKQDVARTEKPRQVREHMVGDRVCSPVDHEQSGLVAARCRGLRHQLRRQRVVKEVGRKRRHVLIGNTVLLPANR